MAKCCDSKSTDETVDLNGNIDVSQKRITNISKRKTSDSFDLVSRKPRFRPCPCEVKVKGLLRIMFMSLYNAIDWSNWKRNEDICESNADLVATCVEQFRLVRGTFVDIQECGTIHVQKQVRKRDNTYDPNGQMFRVKHCITTMWW